MPESQHYERKDAVGEALKGTLIVGGMGTMLSAIQNSLAKQNVGVWGIFTRTGSTIGLFAASGGAYMFLRSASANLRETDDHWNSTIGGAVAGAILGTRLRTMPAVVGHAAALAIILGAFEYTGGSFAIKQRDPNFDETGRKLALRANMRRPLEETVEEIGEGRGVYGPGYEERRRERLAAKYGIDFSNVESS